MTNEHVYFRKNETYEDGPVKSRKKLAILFVKQILTQNTNSCKPFSTSDIIRRLDEYPYSISIGRKAVGHIIKTLEEEYPYIVRTNDGRVYYDRDLKAA